MKRIFILRHAKSSWDSRDLSDFERPLNKRGNKAAPFIGRLMAKHKLIPELIVSSPAERAKQTSLLIRESAGISEAISYDSRIYEANVNTLVHLVSEFDDSINEIMIVGHNPGFENLAQSLVGHYERMPTATLAIADLMVDKWSEVRLGCGKLIELWRPKEQKKLENQ